MHFFERQRVGMIGQTSVSLQKILIFFMICNLFSFFSGGFLQFALCLIGFIGAYKKKPCLLSIYFWVNIAIIVFSLFSVLFIYNSAPQANYEYYSSSASTSSTEQWQSASIESSHASSSSSAPAEHWNIHSLSASAYKIAYSFAGDYSSSSSSSSQSSESSQSVYIDIEPNYSQSSTASFSSEEVASFSAFAFILAILLVFIFAYLQAKALALAWRLRKLLLLPAIPILPETSTTVTPAPQSNEQVHYFPTQENSCAESQPEQQINNNAEQTYAAPPAYPVYSYPYPPAYGVPQGMMMVPHQPTYWGQPPVYYSYAPQPQQPQPNADTKQ
eukprot:TRINITY_DN14878_c0_g1_i1.p1 TRINITY_DN14878_c0_g1~~TRINITY_DN14878_c0_g1_i1.p1  ORF type:complete len:353 (+),score=77.50 TRINITY_DN14878_c0_g1_i1:70-1059(+)